MTIVALCLAVIGSPPVGSRLLVTFALFLSALYFGFRYPPRLVLAVVLYASALIVWMGTFMFPSTWDWPV